MNLLLLQGWVEPIDGSSIDTSAINPSALEKLIENAAPSVQKLVFNIIASIIIFVVGRKLISLLLKILDKFLSHVEMDIGVNKFLQAAARMLLYTLLVFMIVGQLGVNTASIVTILGAGGLAISMSLQGSLSNVAGGILILLMKPFKVGDFVSTPYGDGTVQAIGLVYTTLTTIDNRKLTIPNGELSNAAVFDASAMAERRLDTVVGISYDSDIRRAKEIMEEVYKNAPGYLPEKGVNVHVSSLGDSSIGIEGYGWVRGSEFLAAKWYVMENVKLAYDANGIKIPFPQVDVHLDTGKGAESGQNRAQF
jgi:small conductance mechanosensitive channel